MAYVKSYRDLEVYKLAREVSKEIYMITKGFPVEERYSLTDQIRRSSRSVGAQIAEAWGKEDMSTILFQNLLMLTQNNLKHNIGLKFQKRVIT